MLQTVKFTGQSAIAYYKGRPVYRVEDPVEVLRAERLAKLRGEAAAADYIITVGAPVGA